MGIAFSCMLLVVFAHKVCVAAEKDDVSQLASMLSMPLEELVEVEVVSATGYLKPLRTAPAVASVITAEQIKAMGATTLDEALATVPGLHVYPEPTAFMQPSYAMRGIMVSLNPQVLVMINGVPFSEPTNSMRPHGYRMPVAMIKRIEVVRGPGSAIHGADAFSGSINVITKDSTDIGGTQTGLRYGSFDTTDAWFQHGGNYGGWDMVLSVESQQSQGDEKRVVSEDVLYSTIMGSGVLSEAPGPLNSGHDVLDTFVDLRKDNLTLRAHYGNFEADMGHSGAQAINQYPSYAGGDLFMADFLYHDDDLFQDWDVSLKMDTLYIKGYNYYDFFPHQFRTQLGHPMGRNWVSGLEAIGRYDGISAHQLRFSAGTKAFDTDTDQEKNFGPGVAVQFGPLVNINNTGYEYLDDQNRSLWFLTMQDEWNLAKDWELTAGVRYDHYSDFGSTANPRLALVWETRYDLTTKLMYGRAFRAPTFGEQYFMNNPLTRGNKNLKPETIDTYELAFDYQPTSRLLGILSLFHYDINDQIAYVDSGGGTKTAQNVNDVEGQGFEFEAVWQAVDNLHLKSSFSYQRSKNKSTKEVVPNTPAMQVYANANWQFKKDWTLDGQYFWIADRHRANGDTRSDMADYDLVNLTLRRGNICKNWEAALAVKNLFNKDIREPSPPASAPFDKGITYDYPMESRAIWGELRYSF